jgi:SAM-dependent methyltransferase
MTEGAHRSLGVKLNRELTNIIRFAMDELLPPIIRDNRWFMVPFYMAAYGTLDVRGIMDFKSRVYDMSEADYARFYAELSSSVSRRRATDLNRASLDWLLHRIPDEVGSLIDVGCGNGYLLRHVRAAHPGVALAGCDVIAPSDLPAGADYRNALLPRLPFADAQFDVVLCTHVLEHVIDLVAATRELLRIAGERLLIVVPRQRYYYFTLDEHVNFFWQHQALTRYFQDHKVEVTLADGDWALSVVKTCV